MAIKPKKRARAHRHTHTTKHTHTHHTNPHTRQGGARASAVRPDGEQASARKDARKGRKPQQSGHTAGALTGHQMHLKSKETRAALMPQRSTSRRRVRGVALGRDVEEGDEGVERERERGGFPGLP